MSYFSAYFKQCCVSVLTVSLFIPSTNYAQVVLDEDTSGFVSLEVFGNYYFTQADLASSYGNTAAMGGALHYKTPKGKTYSLSMTNFLGSNVLEKGTDLFGDITTEDGFIDRNGGLSFEQYFFRGMSISASMGRMFTIGTSKKASHVLWIQFGGGFLWHKTKITNPEDRIQILTREFIRGYDKYSHGVQFSQSIGYYVRNRKFQGMRLYIGFEAIEGFTELQRGYGYRDMRNLPNDTRTDILLGFKIGYFVPLRSHKTEEYQYF